MHPLLTVLLVVVALASANREKRQNYGGGPPRGGQPYSNQRGTGGNPYSGRNPGTVTANAKGELGNVAANALSTSGGNVLANALNGTRTSSIAISNLGGDAQANSKGWGSGGVRSNAVAEDGTAKGMSMSLGTGMAQSNAISKGNSAHSSSFSAGGGGSNSNAVSGGRGTAMADSVAKVGKNGEKTEWYTTYMPPHCDRKSKEGDVLTTDYVGYFPDGKKFDSTYDRGEPMTYTMGAGDVIVGAEQSSMGMCVGEKRHSVIPPSLAYGDKEYGGIPPGSTLVFDTVLTKIENGTAKKSTQEMMSDIGLPMNADGSFGLFT